jgi:D-alanyl-D-alanine dipeptidase
MRRQLLLAVLLTSLLPARIPDTGQLLVVTSASWSASRGTLQRYEKRAGKWHTKGHKIAVHLGRKGLGWGRGLHTIPRGAAPIKREGDGKGVAGIFHLKEAFGYHSFGSKYPYRVYKSTHHCVDDTHSRYYNRIVDSTRVKQDYRSFEHMRFAKNYYKYGIAVDHNAFGTARAKRGAGSCIFLHIKSRPTAGCTVMSEPQIKAIIRWLDPGKHPLLVQGPKSIMSSLLKQVGLNR